MGIPEQTGIRVAVVGAGISGLSAALRLQRRGYDTTLFERDDVLGGRMGVATLGDRSLMMGGKNIGRKYDCFRQLVASLGDFGYSSFGINASRVKDGEVITLDSTRTLNSLRTVWKTGSMKDIARLAGLAYRISRNDTNRFLGSDLQTGLARKSDHRPLSEHFGAEIVDTLLRPMTVRNNGAEPDEVYLGTFGTNLSLLMDHYDQLTDGIQPVLEAFAKVVDVRLGATVTDLVVRDGRVAGLTVAGEGDLDFDAVVLASPAYATAGIVRSTLPALAGRLAAVRYFPSIVAVVEYDAPVFRADVRALAMDDGPCSNAGSYGMQERHIVRYTFSGRNGRVQDPTPEQIDAWIAETEVRLVRHLGITIPARVDLVVRDWNAAYCAYLPFHGEFLHDVHRDVARLPGLELAGDYLNGVSLEACCRSGAQAATRLSAQLSPTGAMV